MKTKELPLIEDKIQQIFKAIEVMDISQWNGMNVFEAGAADTLYSILETAFNQTKKEENQRIRNLFDKIPRVSIGSKTVSVESLHRALGLHAHEFVDTCDVYRILQVLVPSNKK